MSREDTFYEAMVRRDPKYDGKFFIGVKTTGIYCRPICPARPKRKNIEFFSTRIEAEKAGYRACKRCRPNAVPFSAAWIGKRALVKRAVRLLQEHTYFDLNEDEFAARLGVTSRHLRRLFKEELGQTPKQLAYEKRLSLARKLLDEKDLTISEVAYAAGFNSVRRFNDAFKSRFRNRPSTFKKR